MENKTNKQQREDTIEKLSLNAAKRLETLKAPDRTPHQMSCPPFVLNEC